MLIATAAIILSGIPADCMAQADTLRVKITGIKTFTGKIMVAGGDYGKPMEMASAMVEADAETVECVISGDIAPGTKLYIFHDANNNFQLDMTNDGVPTEGCYSGTIEPDKNGVQMVELKYYIWAEPVPVKE